MDKYIYMYINLFGLFVPPIEQVKKKNTARPSVEEAFKLILNSSIRIGFLHSIETVNITAPAPTSRTIRFSDRQIILSTRKYWKRVRVTFGWI